MSYESEMFEIIKDAYLHQSWTEEMYLEQNRVFPHMVFHIYYFADNGENFQLTVNLDNDKRTVTAQVLSGSV
jgi:hypothetical protein